MNSRDPARQSSSNRVKDSAAISSGSGAELIGVMPVVSVVSGSDDQQIAEHVTVLRHQISGLKK